MRFTSGVQLGPFEILAPLGAGGMGEVYRARDTRLDRIVAIKLHLSPKAFDLLSILVSDRPKAFAKSDLLDRLWPGTFVVEKNLANLVSEIRDAIGDDPANPRFIRTVHRLVMRFVRRSRKARRAVPRVAATNGPSG